MQKETNQGHKNKVSCLKQGNKMSNFCLKLSQEISRRWWHKKLSKLRLTARPEVGIDYQRTTNSDE